MTKVLRIVLVTVVMAFIVGITVELTGIEWEMVSCIAAGIVSATTASLYEFVDTHGQGLKIWFQSMILHYNQRIRNCYK